MKLIKKAPAKAVNKLAKLNVGDQVLVKTFAPDGRNGTIVGKYDLAVLKVNKVTFDGQDKDGNVYRVDQYDNWTVKAVA